MICYVEIGRIIHESFPDSIQRMHIRHTFPETKHIYIYLQSSAELFIMQKTFLPKKSLDLMYNTFDNAFSEQFLWEMAEISKNG